MMLLACLSLQAQVPDETRKPAGTPVPLYVFTNGSGHVDLYLQNRPQQPVALGGMFPSGTELQLIARPFPGYQFVNWQPVEVYEVQSVIVNPFGGSTNFNHAIDVVPLPGSFRSPVMQVSVPPVELLYLDTTTNESGVIFTNNELTKGTGWEACFEPWNPRHRR